MKNEAVQLGWYAEQTNGTWEYRTRQSDLKFPDKLRSLLTSLAGNALLAQSPGGFYATCFQNDDLLIYVMHGFAVTEDHFAGQLAVLPAVTGDFRGERLLRDRLETGDSPNLVHALKAPVSRIVGLAEVLLASPDIAGENRRLVQYMEQSAFKLRELIGMVLEEPLSATAHQASGLALSHTVSQFMKLHSAQPADAHAVHIESAVSGVEHLRLYGMPPMARLFTGSNGLLAAPLGLTALHGALQAEVLVFSANNEAIDVCVCSQAALENA